MTSGPSTLRLATGSGNGALVSAGSTTQLSVLDRNGPC